MTIIRASIAGKDSIVTIFGKDDDSDNDAAATKEATEFVDDNTEEGEKKED